MTHHTKDTVAGTVTLAVQNPAADNPVIYVGVSATLNITLSNQTGSDIDLQNDSGLQIYMPFYFSQTELQAMSIDTISAAGWTFVASSNDGPLLLNSSSGTWASGTSLTFNIENVLSSNAAASDTVQVNFNNFSGNNIPAQDSVTLTLSNPVVPGNVNLDTVLQVSTELNGEVYVSTTVDPVTNTLYVNLKNISTAPLYTGLTQVGSPQVSVSFVYGDTSGALAPDTKSNTLPPDSAWNISGSVSVNETGGWTVQNPSPDGQANSPVWILAPDEVNINIIGTGANANVTFAFSNILSFTLPGPTQMYLDFTGFMQNETTAYNDERFVADITKLLLPTNVGLLGFYNSPSMFAYTTGNGNTPGTAAVNLYWYGFAIASVGLEYKIAGQPSNPASPFSKTYPDTEPLVQDSVTLSIPNVIGGDQLNFTLYAYDADGTVINALAFPVSVDQQAAAYQFSGPAAAVNFNLDQAAAVELNWQTFGVSAVEITCESPNAFSYNKTYVNISQWNPDSIQVGLSIPLPSATVEFTLNAYDANGNLLNSMQCTVNFTATGWCDPKDQQVYPIVTLGNQVWMAENYAYNDPSGDAIPYNNDPNNLPVYGRFYPLESAMQNVPVGWRIPTYADWENLINTYGTGMTMGGLNLVNAGVYEIAQLGGFENQYTMGCYWSMPATPDSWAALILSNDTVTQFNFAPPENLMMLAGSTVRYVMNNPLTETT